MLERGMKQAEREARFAASILNRPKQDHQERLHDLEYAKDALQIALDLVKEVKAQVELEVIEFDAAVEQICRDANDDRVNLR